MYEWYGLDLRPLKLGWIEPDKAENSSTMAESWQDFFVENESPKNIDSVVADVDNFCSKFKDQKIVLVTSGGTTIPFEKNTVR